MSTKISSRTWALVWGCVQTHYAGFSNQQLGLVWSFLNFMGLEGAGQAVVTCAQSATISVSHFMGIYSIGLQILKPQLFEKTESTHRALNLKSFRIIFVGLALTARTCMIFCRCLIPQKRLITWLLESLRCRISSVVACS